MKSIWTVGLVCVAASLIAGLAFAQPAQCPAGQGPAKGQHPLMDKLKQADTNKDHKVTYEELKAVAPDFPEARFKELDKNGDGAITAEDRPLGAGPHGRGAGERLRAADKDGDKKITKEEFKAQFPNAPEGAFARADHNKDGVLTAEDRSAGGPRGPKGPNAQKKEAGAPTPKGAAKADKPAKDAAKKRAAEFAARLKKADTNQDQNVSKEEFKAAFPKATDERFTKLDRNGDGVLNSADRKRPPAK